MVQRVKKFFLILSLCLAVLSLAACSQLAVSTNNAPVSSFQVNQGQPFGNDTINTYVDQHIDLQASGQSTVVLTMQNGATFSNGVLHTEYAGYNMQIAIDNNMHIQWVKIAPSGTKSWQQLNGKVTGN